MRTTDLVSAALGGLWRQKARSTLTLLGVAVGACALAFSLALGLGLRAFIDNEFMGRNEFWSVTVFPAGERYRKIALDEIPPDEIAVDGEMNPERRNRIQDGLIENYRRIHPPKQVPILTLAKLDQLAAMPNIEKVITYRMAYGSWSLGDRTREANIYMGPLEGFAPALSTRLLWGRLPRSPEAQEAVVSEFALYQLGVRNDRDCEALLGQPIRVVVGQREFGKGLTLMSLLNPGRASTADPVSRSQSQTLEKIARQLPSKIESFDLTAEEKLLVKLAISAQATAKSQANADPEKSAIGSYPVVGIVREVTEDEVRENMYSNRIRVGPASIYLQSRTGEQIQSQLREAEPQGYPEALLRVKPGSDLATVVDQLRAEGLEVVSSLKWYRNVKREVTLIAAGLNLFALISLLVASIGITNTLFTSVLERTREIGIWKSLGARDGQILILFLTEGAAVGLVGGLLGLMVAIGLSYPADDLVQRLIQEQSPEHKTLGRRVFDFPTWVTAGSVGFAAIITTLAALYPARRAARVQPVEALRHE